MHMHDNQVYMYFFLFVDKIINGHNILLQLGLVKPYWRTFGSAAGLGEGLLDMVHYIHECMLLKQLNEI